MRPPQERGVALLTVLLLVAAMSTVAVGVLDDLRFGLRRAANAEAVSQARWYAIGAETLARARLARLDDEALRRADGWNGRVFRFPIEGGTLQARASDGAGCFNLNSVVLGAGEVLQVRPEGVRQFRALLLALGVGGAESLAGALVDWIDSNPLREPGGAEDEAYRGYRTGGALLAEVSELRAVRGFDAATYARIRPYVCALPTPELSPINVNSLASDRAVLLTMLTDGALPVAAARRVIASRPAQGWTDGEFWNLPALAEAIPSGEALGQIRTTPRFFILETQVDYLDAEVVSTALMTRDAPGRVTLALRRWTRDE